MSFTAARAAAGVHPDRGRGRRLGALLVDVDVRLVDHAPDVERVRRVWMPLKSAAPRSNASGMPSAWSTFGRLALVPTLKRGRPRVRSNS